MTHRLIYVADPMCSWCYGFGPELSGVFEAMPGMDLEIVVGGLRAYNTRPMDESLKATLISHWRHVAEASGLPFSNAAIARAGFVYDTEPACRAVVATRLLTPDLAPHAQLDVFHAIQRAFYADGVDVTQGPALADIASAALTKQGVSIDAASFLAKWSDETCINETRSDFAKSQRWGISGFPTLLLESVKSLSHVVSGYAKTAALQERIGHLTAQSAA